MFFFRHPKSIIDPRAVAMMVVKQKTSAKMDTQVLVVEKREVVAPVAAIAQPIQSESLLRPAPSKKSRKV